VEGDSAGGSAKQGRKPEYQAILPLRGKILNVEKTRFDKIISSETIGTLITALGCGIRDAYNPDNLRYHNIVIMTDADVDGAHIRILLLTFFYRQMPDLIERGHIYIAQPPLYKYSKSEKNFRYITDEVEKNEYETSLALNEAQLFVNPDAPPIFGEPLENIFLQYVNLFPLYRRIDRRIPEMLTSELVFVDPLTEEDMKDSAKFENWKNSFESRLKQKEVPGLVYTVHTKFREDKQLYYPEVSVLHYGVTKEYDLPYEFFVSQDYGKIAKVSKIINGLLEENAYVRCGAKTKTVTDFGQVHDFLLKEGLSGIKIMRFKGLGEMNPDELFNTTMNPDHRVFLKVTLNDAIEANEAFTKLMGEEVAPRKEFISENAHLAEIDA
jgi:DNA gyrase subunit B